MTIKFAFNTRMEYQEQARQWKSEYQELALSIRNLIVDYRESQRMGQGTSNLYRILRNRRQVATTMLKNRIESKKTAEAQFVYLRVPNQ